MIKIPVSADFDSTQAEAQIRQFAQKLNAMGQQVAQQNKMQYTPINPKSIEDLKKLNAQFVALQKVSGDLRKRITATGQGGASFVDLDWSKLYPDAASRSRQMQKAFQYVTGASFLPMGGGGGGGARPPGGGGGGGGAGSPWAQAGVNAIRSGFGAANGFTGGASGVAGGALSTGLSSGFGAGLMGLFGGMLALGVGKLVGAVTEKVGQAEDNNVAYDKLKRTIGDVNVSFDGLKKVLSSAAENTRTTYAETARLGQQFAKLGNVTTDQYKGLGRDVEMGIGLSRGFGLDPEQGVGALGQMRGVRFSRNEQDTRRFALLIGETIGKSGAFAKADEVMDALSNYTAAQTRQSLGMANAAGYAGTYSALVGSGIAGLDPSGAGALLSRVNASLAAGGAKGEASQFFSSIVASRMGLNPLQMQVLREGGAFATNDEAFGPDSIAHRYGMAGPGGSKTFLQGSLEELRRQYGGNKGLLAQATANHLGIGMRQAMALLSVNPNQIGDMQKYADLGTLSGSGIGNLSKVLYGSSSDRSAVAKSLLGRKGDDALTPAEAAKLEEVMKNGSEEAQKKVLAELVAGHEQERTMGSDIRDSKNALDNIKTSLADKLVPLTQEMRHGIMYLAGGGKKSSVEVMADVLRLESKDKVNAIEAEYRRKVAVQSDKIVAARNSERTSDPESMRRSAEIQKAANDEIERLTLEKKKALEEENRLLQQRIEQMRKNAAELSAVNSTVEPSFSRRRGTGGGAVAIQQSTASALEDIKDPNQRRNVKSFLDLISATEGAGYNTVVGGGTFSDMSQHPNRVGLVTADGPSTAAGRYQITGTTWRRLQKKLGLKDFSPTSQDRAAIELLHERGALDDVLRGDWEAAARKLGSEWVSLPSSTNRNQGRKSWGFAKRNWEAAQARNYQPMPDEAAAEQRREASRAKALSVTVEPLRVIHENTRGEQVRPSETLNTKVSPAKPFGAGN